MSDVTNTNRPNLTPEATPVEPAGDASPKSAADEMFAHGLLTYLHTDTPARQDQRVRRVMTALQAGHAVARPRTLRFPIRTGRGWLALAACLTLGTVAVFVGIPGEQSAQAVVQQSIDAMRSTSGGDRRYEIRLTRRAEETLPSLPGAIIDTRSPNLLLLRANAPDGHEIIAGRDSTGDWAIRMDGGVERTHPEVAWPRWAKVGDESLFVDSVDRLLEELTKSYNLQKEGTATIEGKGTTSYRHIVGTKKRHPSPGGDRVEVWIDPATKSVERLEMRWDLPKPREGDMRGPNGGPDDRHEGGPMGGPNAQHTGGPDQPDGPGPQGRGDDRPEGGPADGPPRDPMHRRPPRGDGPSDGPPPRGPDADGRAPNGPDDLGPNDDDRPAPRGPGGPEGRRPEGRFPRGPEGGPDGGPRGGPLDGPRRRPEPRPEGGPPPRDHGPRNGAGPDDRGDRPLPGGPGPRGPGPGLRPQPPRLLVMQRVDVPTLESTWFSPETHVAR